MHVAGVNLDLNWFLQLILTVFVIVVVLLHFVKNTASKYFEVDANFEGAGGEEGAREGRRGGERSGRNSMPGVLMDYAVCIVCGNSGSKKCSRCKAVRYCSQKCQEVHWKSGHKTKCKEFQSSARVNSTETSVTNTNKGLKASCVGSKILSSIALVPAHGVSKPIKHPKRVLFPYDEFVKLFYWDRHQFPPCGLLNCGNSCFANVVLQCLTFTRPLVAYLLEKGHRRECIRDDWCFLCEFQTHVERASRSVQSFSPNNIISRLPNIGGNLGYGRQEDAHEFMRFAIDTMQSVCLDEFGGEKAVHPLSQETTIIQHIFGGHLQSQVVCMNCNNISNQYENMMDLTVEIHGDAASLEECLDQFTTTEWLHGDNMYKCDGCNNYVKASKRLTVKQAPNILTIALKRFQSGSFGKLNKKVTFPKTLDLSPYMSEAGDGTDVYKLYAVVVHVDMLNASYFGHYICYIKDLSGNWHWINDYKVENVGLEEVLSQGAYMIFYSRVRTRPSSLQNIEPSREDQPQMVNRVLEDCPKEQVGSLIQPQMMNGVLEDCLKEQVESGLQKELSEIHPESLKADLEDMDVDVVRMDSSTSKSDKSSSSGLKPEAVRENAGNINLPDTQTSSSVPKEEVSSCDKGASLLLNYKDVRDSPIDINKATTKPGIARGDSDDLDVVSYGSSSYVRKDVEIVNGRTCMDEFEVNGNGDINANEKISRMGVAHQMKGRSANGHFKNGNGAKRVEAMGDG